MGVSLFFLFLNVGLHVDIVVLCARDRVLRWFLLFMCAPLRAFSGEPSAMASTMAIGFGDRVVCGQEGVCALGRLRVY